MYWSNHARNNGTDMSRWIGRCIIDGTFLIIHQVVLIGFNSYTFLTVVMPFENLKFNIQKKD